jgi:hypothetical protein
MDDRRGLEHARVIGRAVLANLESLVAGGLAGPERDQVVAICRALTGLGAAPEATAGLLGQLRVLLLPVRGLAAGTFLGWLDDERRSAAESNPR